MSDGQSPIDWIASSRWEHALFTTYALSLTFFETHILKNCLIKTGCRNIWVVADVEGYQQSLAERQSSRVGHEYRLIPVALTNGVFHPKCTYLSGPDGDLLMVSSGNLTFGGCGRNIEVMEMFHSSQTPGVFTGFGEFLQALNKRADFLNPDQTWTKTFSDLAVLIGNGEPNDGVSGPRLIHSVTEPAVEQLQTVVKANRGSARLKVLSPFFDPQATAVRILAEKTDCRRVTIGLVAGYEERSTFPFNGKLSKEIKFDAALVSDKRDGRRLHAKWFEADLNNGRCLIFTGSVNATEKSLCKTDNIEVGVLRVEPRKRKGPLSWKPCPLPKTHVTLKFRKGGIGQRIIVHARIARHGELIGNIISERKLAGVWEVAVVRPDGEMVKFQTDVAADGSFRAPIPHAEHYATQTGLQVLLSRDGVEGRGWVQNDEILKLPRLPHLGITSLIRLINNEQTDDDDAALLEYLALSAQEHLPTFRLDPKPAKRSETAETEKRHAATIDVERLKPTSEPGEQLLPSNSPEAALDEIFGRLRRRLLVSLGARTRIGRASSSTDETEAEEDQEQRQPKRLLSGLERFDNAMNELVDRIQDQNQLKAAFNMWLEVELVMLTERLKDDEKAESFCRRWLHEATTRCLRDGALATFDRYLFTVAATLAGNILCQADEDSEQTGRLAYLHEELERYCRGVVPTELASTALITNPGDVISEKVRLPGAADLRLALDRLLSTRTFREEVEILLGCIAQGREPPSDLSILEMRAGEELRECLAREEPIAVVEWRNGSSACPKCHLVLPEPLQHDLQTQRIARCCHCQRFLVNRS